MTPSILFVGCGSFLLCLSVHVIVWRRKHPHHHALALFGIFFLPLGVLVPLFFFGTQSWVDSSAMALLHAALSSAYVQIYPASQAASPSLRILVMVGDAKSRGLSEAQIRSQFDQEQLFQARIRDLVMANLASESNGTLVLTPRGRAFITPFILLRSVLGAPAAQG